MHAWHDQNRPVMLLPIGGQRKSWSEVNPY